MRVLFCLCRVARFLVLAWSLGFFDWRYTPLGRAVSRGDVDAVRYLLHEGANVHVSSVLGPVGLLGFKSPLFTSALLNHAHITLELLLAGTDPIVGMQLGPFGCMAEWSPLYIATLKDHPLCVARLLDAGADAERGVTYLYFLHDTPLEAAMRYDRAVLVRLLDFFTSPAILLQAHARAEAMANYGPHSNRTWGLWAMAGERWE